MSNVGSPGGAGWDDQVLRDLLTVERLGSYLQASGKNLAGALRLYEWNMTASAVVLSTTGMVEIVVRNALDRQLIDWAVARGHPSWLDAARLDKRGLDDIAKARARATNHGRIPERHGKVVAELSFGFWRYLASQRYHASLWVPALNRAFPHGPADLRERRRNVEGHLQRLMLVRNRAAHHEPIHRRDLLADLRSAVQLTAWVHPQAGAWVSAQSTLDREVDKRAAL